MDILSTARKLEAALSERLDRAAERVRTVGPREPLEIAHAIVDAVARHIQPGGRGRYVFPFNRVKVSLLAATKDARARLEGVLDGEPSLHDRIVERLASAGCDSGDVDVKMTYVVEPAGHWADREFHLELQRVGERVRSAQSPEKAAALKLTIEHGKAEKTTYTFTATRVDLGRCADVRDSRNRLLRTNHVAFADGSVEVNASVSRQHAHIAYDRVSGHHRVCDDRSAHGTGVLRTGRIISVPPGARGIRIQSGDVIVLGEARVRVTLQDP